MTEKEYQELSKQLICPDALTDSRSPVYRILNIAKRFPELFRNKADAMDEVIAKAIAMIQSGEQLTFGQWMEEYLDSPLTALLESRDEIDAIAKEADSI